MYGMIGHDLFGEERGQVSLSNITKARILDEDMEEFELKVGNYLLSVYSYVNSTNSYTSTFTILPFLTSSHFTHSYSFPSCILFRYLTVNICYCRLLCIVF